MFKLDKSPKMPTDRTEFCISAESVITGSIQTKSDIRVDGQIKGDLDTSGNVYVGKTAKVDGNISGMDIHLAGVVNGQINAAGEVMLYADAQLAGDIKAAGIRVEKDTRYEGKISIGMNAPMQAPDIDKQEEQ